ncbi:MAG: helicase HerA domain-containing protein [Acidimicrobiia bacterium]
MTVELRLGETVDPSSGDRTGGAISIDAADLTTHGVIVGMTGSGKTGLGVVLLEEALRAGIPTLVLDPKGDMTNLALRFPGLTTEEFAPWVPAGSDPAATATTWREGLASWGLGTADVADLDARSRVTVYTPGSTAGVGLDLVGSLAPPTGVDQEGRADEVDGVVSGLLALVGIEADPLSSREHILLANLVERAWAAGEPLDLGRLVHQVQEPPLRKLGVLDLDSFYRAADRSKLALQLNGLLASPAFSAWSQGVPIDVGAMLAPVDGKASCSVIYLAHLGEEERQFVVTLVLSKLVTWMRAQPGTPDLRALVYMDEVFGYVPPTAAPPAKKPILTVLKQARAYGVGMVLSTQNPVDLDYKALSNAGTWMVGRLQTERDVARLRDGLTAASGAVDVDALGTTIAGLGKRAFVLHSTKGSAPAVFTTRWALDYLAGPLTKDQVGALPGAAVAPTAPVAASPAAAPAGSTTPVADRPVALADDESPVPPTVADDVPVRWVDPAAPWLPEVGGDPTSTRHAAVVVVRAALVYDETKADLRHAEEFECVLTDLGAAVDVSGRHVVDHDDRDLRDAAPAVATYRLPEAPLDRSGWFADVRKAVVDHLYAERTLVLRRNAELDLWSRPGESEGDFLARCRAAAAAKVEEEAADVRARLERRMGTVRTALEREQTRVAELQARASDAKQHEVLSAAGDLLGAFLGGRRSARSVLTKVKGASSRRNQTSAAGQRVETALEKVEQRTAELADLEAELVDALADLDADWAEKAEAIDEVEVGLEKTDVEVRHLVLAWLPS